MFLFSFVGEWRPPYQKVYSIAFFANSFSVNLYEEHFRPMFPLICPHQACTISIEQVNNIPTMPCYYHGRRVCLIGKGHASGCKTSLSGMQRYPNHVYCLTPNTSHTQWKYTKSPRAISGPHTKTVPTSKINWQHTIHLDLTGWGSPYPKINSSKTHGGNCGWIVKEFQNDASSNTIFTLSGLIY